MNKFLCSHSGPHSNQYFLFRMENRKWLWYFWNRNLRLFPFQLIKNKPDHCESEMKKTNWIMIFCLYAGWCWMHVRWLMIFSSLKFVFQCSVLLFLFVKVKRNGTRSTFRNWLWIFNEQWTYLCACDSLYSNLC